MKVFIIDTFNLIHKDEQITQLFRNDMNSGISAIAGKISAFANRYKSYKFKLVLDGAGYNPLKPSPNIIFIESSDTNADNKIKELIRKTKNTKHIKVVSSDTEVYNFAKANACDVITSEDFSKKIIFENPTSKTQKYSSGKKNSEKPTRPTKAEMKELLDAFKENDK